MENPFVRLPIEMVMQIFRYLPSCDNVYLVSKQFYEAACRLNDRNMFLTLDDKFFRKQNYDEILLNMQKTTRQISDVRFKYESFVTYAQIERRLPPTISVINKFSATIKSLHFTIPIEIEDAFVIEMLSLVPNVEHLTLHFGEPFGVRKPSQIVRRRNKVLKLRQLRTLNIQCRGQVGHDVSFLCIRLPVGVLTKLAFFGGAEALEILLKRQRNIRDFEVTLIYGDVALVAKYIDKLHLESFDWCNYNSNTNPATILSKQTKLKKLRVSSVDQSIMNFIGDRLSELETLDIRVVSYTAAIVDIGKLNLLKHLTVRASNTPLIKSIAQLDNSRLTTLEIQINCSYGIETHVIAKLSQSVPNLKELRIGRLQCRDLLNAIRINFNFVELLEIDYCEEDSINGLSLTESFNPNLTDLTISLYGILCNENFLRKLGVDHPNLTKFAFRCVGNGIPSCVITAWKLQEIFESFPKLKSLELLFQASTLTAKELDSMQHYQNNLKFLLLKTEKTLIKKYRRR